MERSPIPCRHLLKFMGTEFFPRIAGKKKVNSQDLFSSIDPVRYFCSRNFLALVIDNQGHRGMSGALMALNQAALALNPLFIETKVRFRF